MKLVINRDIPIGELSKRDGRFFKNCGIYVKDNEIICQKITLTPSKMDRVIKQIIYYSGEWGIEIMHYPDYMEIEQKK